MSHILSKSKLNLVAILVTVFAAGSVVAEDYKIGAVNTIRILEESPRAVTADTLIKEEFSARDRKLLSAQKELKAMEESLAKDNAVMSETERKKVERKIISARRDLKRDQEEFREDVNFRFNEVRSDIQKEIFEAVVEISKKGEYDLVLFDGVAYASAKADISDLVISYLKEKYKEEKE